MRSSAFFRLIALLSTSCSALASAVSQNQHVFAIPQSRARIQIDSPKPFYIIAHRVLTKEGISTALEDGANAIEIDAMSYYGGWRAAHDDGDYFAGDDMRTMFETIAAARKAAKVVSFVWLDIKTPDKCDSETRRACSLLALQDVAREILEPVGVRVLYGFSAQVLGIKTIGSSLNYNEAIAVDCEAGDVSALFDSIGPKLKLDQAVYTCGSWYSPVWAKRKDEMVEAIRSKKFVRTLGWTVGPHQGDVISEWVEAGVDGLIYGGTPAATYGARTVFGQVTAWIWTFGHSWNQRDNERKAQRMIQDWVTKNPSRRYVAKQEDKPW